MGCDIFHVADCFTHGAMIIIPIEERLRVLEETKNKNNGVELLQNKDRTLNESSNTVGKRWSPQNF